MHFSYREDEAETRTILSVEIGLKNIFQIDHASNACKKGLNISLFITLTLNQNGWNETYKVEPQLIIYHIILHL